MLILILMVICSLTILALRKRKSKDAFASDFTDEYEIDFDERHKGQFIGRFDMDPWKFRNHYD